MKGTDRLRKLSTVIMLRGSGIDTALLSIANQIERETQPKSGHAADMPMSAYDLMPEGAQWPRFEDGEPVRIGDEVEAPTGRITVEAIEFSRGKVRFKDAEDGDWITSSYAMHPLKRPAPKVLDADGAEIREGDTVWHVKTGEQCKVFKVDSRSVSVDFRADGDGIKHTGGILPVNLTHRAPVLAADGVPLREGETVWVTEDRPFDAPLERGDEVTVEHVYSLNIEIEDKAGDSWIVSSFHLTHERPDSWERLEEDATLAVKKYRECHGIKRHDGMTWPQLVREDLVRRARALAERGR